ncbi:MAG: hypothetical protein HY376_03280 [Candidatus Blackburnbacteria bacterium]|nr:hypothetical protein [Candidatus Blackburnbacteria bacterium]
MDKWVGLEKVYERKTGRTIEGKKVPRKEGTSLTVDWRTGEKLDELKNHVKGCKRISKQLCSVRGCDSYNDVIKKLIWNRKSEDEWGEEEEDV